MYFKGKGDVLASFSNELERKICYFVPAVVFSPKLTIVFSSNITKIKVSNHLVIKKILQYN